MKIFRTFALFWVAATAALPQSGEFLSTPRLGWTVGGDGRELRALLGVPGAGRVSDAIALPEGVTRLYLAPGQEYALGYGEESGNWYVVSLRDDSLFSLQAIDALHDGQGRVVFAPGGGAFAVTGPGDDTARIFTVTGGIAQPAWSVAIDASSSLALHHTGDRMLAAGAAGVTLHRRGADSVHLPPVQELSDIAFQPLGDSAVIADAGQRVLLILDTLASAPSLRTILVAGDIGAPAAVAWSGDGHHVWCASREASALARIDIASGAIDQIDTDIPVRQFHQLPGRDHFLISPPVSGQAAWLLLAQADRIATYFVPGNPEGVGQ